VIDTSRLKPKLDLIGHRIPFEAVGFLHGYEKDKTTNLFIIDKPYPMNAQFWQLKSAPSSPSEQH
jgi:hypothetical protein